MNYLIGLLVAHHVYRVRTTALAIGTACNIGLLLFFKYVGFLAETLNGVLPAVGMPTLTVPDVHLPLGISFFTFQAMSYLIDVYRGEARLERNPLNVALYIAMFPQLIAGPIVRFQTVAEEIRTRSHSLHKAALGIRIFIVGLGQKVLLANTVAVAADAIFGLPQSELGVAVSWLGVLCYSLQIYFDFGGYSNMAIGLGLIMGFHFPANFNYPYVAQSLTDFWQRWHMTLSRWFRDYLYIPLGGNRKGPVRTYMNLWIVFFLCGLWHGASWSFAVWGCYQGAFMVLERLWLTRRLARLYRPFRHVYTLLVVGVGWVLFRCETLHHALQYLWAMAGGAGSQAGLRSPAEFLTPDVVLAAAVGMVAATPIARWVGARLGAWSHPGSDERCPPLRAAGDVVVTTGLVCILVLSSISLASGGYNPFIYFRF